MKVEIEKKKVIENNSKHLRLLSDKGGFQINARMKVDYDSVNRIFGARCWVYEVLHLPSRKKVIVKTNGTPIFKQIEYQCFTLQFLKILIQIPLLQQKIF